MEQWLMSNKMERVWKKAVVVWTRHYPDICLKGLRENKTGGMKQVPPEIRSFRCGNNSYWECLGYATKL